MALFLINLHKIQKVGVVSALAPNVSALHKAHFVVSIVGVILDTVISRLNAQNVAIVLSDYTF